MSQIWATTTSLARYGMDATVTGLQTYRAPAFFLVRDWRLSVVSHTLTVGVVLFMAIYVYMYEKQYFECQPASGVLTFEAPERGVLMADGVCDANGTKQYTMDWVGKSCYADQVQSRVAAASDKLAAARGVSRPQTVKDQRKLVCNATAEELGISAAAQAAYAASDATDTQGCEAGLMLIHDLQDRVKCFTDKTLYLGTKPLPNLAHKCVLHHRLLRGSKNAMVVGAANTTELATLDFKSVMVSPQCQLGTVPIDMLYDGFLPEAIGAVPWTPSTASACNETISSVSRYTNAVAGTLDWSVVEQQLSSIDPDEYAVALSRIPKSVASVCNVDATWTAMVKERTVNKLTLITYVSTRTETRLIQDAVTSAEETPLLDMTYEETAIVDLDNIFLPFTMVISSDFASYAEDGHRFGGSLGEIDVIMFDANGTQAPSKCHWHMFHHGLPSERYMLGGHCFGDEHWNMPCMWDRHFNKTMTGEGSKLSMRSLLRTAQTPTGVRVESLEQVAATVLGEEQVALLGFSPDATLQQTGFAMLVEVAIDNTFGIRRTGSGLAQFLPTHVTAKMHTRIVPSASLDVDISFQDHIKGFEYKVSEKRRSEYGITIDVFFQGQVCKEAFIPALLALPTLSSLIAVVAIVMIYVLPFLPGGGLYASDILRTLQREEQEARARQAAPSSTQLDGEKVGPDESSSDRSTHKTTALFMQERETTTSRTEYRPSPALGDAWEAGRSAV